jgi:hypothetical protein
LMFLEMRESAAFVRRSGTGCDTASGPRHSFAAQAETTSR